MPSADQIKALLKAYAQGDDAQFHSIAMQIAAGEARIGHGKLAEEIRELVDAARVRVPAGGTTPIPLARPKGEVAELLTVNYPKTRLNDLVLAPSTLKILERVVREHKTVRDIRAHGLTPRKKLLLVGPPGTGKTMTASAIAGELALPLFTVRLDRLITRYMGKPLLNYAWSLMQLRRPVPSICSMNLTALAPSAGYLTTWEKFAES